MAQAERITGSTLGERIEPRTIADDAPWSWLAQAITIYLNQPVLCAGYGILFVGIGYGMALALTSAGLAAAMPVALGAFALMGPLMAAGVYSIARAAEEGRSAGYNEVVFPRAAAPSQIAYLGVMLLVGVFVWVVVAFALFAMLGAGEAVRSASFGAFLLGTGEGLLMLVLGTAIGGLIALAIFAASAFSIPMLMDRDTDFVSAISASVAAVRRNLKPMLLWAWLIAFSVALGGATLLFGFIVLFPLLGIATWIGYRDTFPSR